MFLIAHEGKTHTSRGCEDVEGKSRNELSGSCENYEENGKTIEVCYCSDQDGCNGVPWHIQTPILSLLTTCAISLISYALI